MSASPFRRFMHRVLTWSGPTLLVLVSIYQVLVWLSERLWFESLGYGAHFGRLFGWRAGAFCAGALIFGSWMSLHAHIAWRNASRRSVPLSFFQSDDASRLIPLEDKLHLDRYRRRATLLILAALSWMAGLSFSARYALFVRAFSMQSTGVRDGASGFDLAFFLFALPFYVWLSHFLFVALVAALLMSVAIYLYEEVIGPRVDHPISTSGRAPAPAPRGSRAAARHLAVLWAMLLLWKGLDCVLSVPRSFVSGGGAATRVFDPLDISFGWTSAGLFALSAPLLALLSGLSVARAPRARTFVAGMAWMASASLAPALLPLIVARDARNPEWTGALARHIDSTRRAWGLGNVTRLNLAGAADALFRAPTGDETGASAPLPLWPSSAAQGAFNRRLERSDSPARVSRVWLERAGDSLIYCGLAWPPKPASSGSWRGRHGRRASGVWMRMEANRVSPAGTPIFRPDIPVGVMLGASSGAETVNPNSRARLVSAQNQPGEVVAVSTDSDEWIIGSAETGTAENFAAPRGVSLAGRAVKTLLAARFLDPWLARATERGDQLIWHRGAAERCQELAPFLDWQRAEARPVWIADAGADLRGALQWIVPGLVWSDNHPDSAALAAPGAAPPGANYGSHVATGVVDARTGVTTLYSLDQDEPFMALYGRAFPGLFELPTSLPGGIRAALRPSPSLLGAQTLIWARYHESEPLSWVSHRADYRPLFLSSRFEDASLRPLASHPSGDWNFMAYARPEGQVGSSPAAPLAAILGADERNYGSDGAKTRFVEWRAPLPLALPEILVEPVVLTPGSPGLSPPTLLGVAPQLDEKGIAKGLIVTRGAATETPGPPRQIRLKTEIRVSGFAPNAALSAAPAPFVTPALRLQQARAAWREMQRARQKGDWEAVARAETRLEAALQSPPGTR